MVTHILCSNKSHKRRECYLEKYRYYFHKTTISSISSTEFAFIYFLFHHFYTLIMGHAAKKQLKQERKNIMPS